MSLWPCRVRVVIHGSSALDRIIADGDVITFDHEAFYDGTLKTFSYTFTADHNDSYLTSTARLVCNDSVGLSATNVSTSASIEFIPAGTIHSARFKSFSSSGASSFVFMIDGVPGAGIYGGLYDINPAPTLSWGGKVGYISPYILNNGLLLYLEDAQQTSVTYPVFASDDSLVVAHNESGITTPPDIAGHDYSAPADLLTIMSAPLHGTAVVSGSSIIYTPTAGYSGPDSYTYQASLYGDLTNIATVSITVMPIITAPDESMTVAQNSAANSVTPVITQDGVPVTPDSLTIVTQPTHGTASVSGAALLYTPAAGYMGADSFTYKATVAGVDSNVATVSITMLPTYNCDCDDTTDHRTLKQLRDDLMVRLGFAAQVGNPPPGMAALLNSFLIEAQELLYRRYDVLRTERFYSWSLQEGVRMYDFADNQEACTKRIDPRKVTWVGVVRDGLWRALACGIAPELYSVNGNGWPQRYEIRQCIEVWPAPSATEGNLIIKGHFGIEAFAADTDKTTIDDRLVFLLALANAKAHYGKPDANNYVQQLETMMQGLVAGAHQTRRYLPGRDGRTEYVYSQPKPTEPFA